MRKFIVSDLHGNGAIYDSIVNYLENLYNEGEDVTLYINGDLIDKGFDSARILLDVKDRIENKKSFKIKYLAGNHELIYFRENMEMGDDFYNPSKWDEKLAKWYTTNGTNITIKAINEMKLSKEQINGLVDFISNLKIYHKFEEKINNKNIVLVHAKCPEEVHDICDLRIKDDSKLVEDLVWSRRNSYEDKIGNKDYFTIIGHEPLINRYGYLYFSDQNYMDIDGGCANYACGDDRYDHVALVEVLDDSLRILTFNNNNEIIFGNTFEDGRNTSIDKLDEYRKHLVKTEKKMSNIRIVS